MAFLVRDPVAEKGSRIFNIDIENGQEQLNNYDIIVAAGGSATAIIESFTGLSVNDGNLTITLTSVVEFPKISGIEVFVEGGSSSPPIADAGEDRTITLPNNSMTLDGFCDRSRWRRYHHIRLVPDQWAKYGYLIR